jgi:hypothetical protein
VKKHRLAEKAIIMSFHEEALKELKKPRIKGWMA